MKGGFLFGVSLGIGFAIVDIGWIHKQPEFTAICQLCGRVEPLDHSGGAENG
jgi:hypothetical protein